MREPGGAPRFEDGLCGWRRQAKRARLRTRAPEKAEEEQQRAALLLLELVPAVPAERDGGARCRRLCASKRSRGEFAHTHSRRRSATADSDRPFTLSALATNSENSSACVARRAAGV